MTENRAYCSFQGWLQTEKITNCREQITRIIMLYYVVNRHLLNSLFLLRSYITLKPKKELYNFRFFVHKMTGQSLKLGKFMADHMANRFGHVRLPSVISTPGILINFLDQSFGWTPLGNCFLIKNIHFHQNSVHFFLPNIPTNQKYN